MTFTATLERLQAHARETVRHREAFSPVLATDFVRAEIIAVFTGVASEIAPHLSLAKTHLLAIPDTLA